MLSFFKLNIKIHSGFLKKSQLPGKDIKGKMYALRVPTIKLRYLGPSRPFHGSWIPTSIFIDKQRAPSSLFLKSLFVCVAKNLYRYKWWTGIYFKFNYPFQGRITWRISSRAEISDRLLKQILWKPNCRLHGEGFSPGRKRNASMRIDCVFAPHENLRFAPGLKLSM